ncbi:MAG: potassium channel family protein, partial [Abditibacteriales bacterium]|nr:potassium channel family protein [Abditibacteriales bacterium]MDW8366460.1 potassium channel family protein [Abditibacteriales bacterium]
NPELLPPLVSPPEMLAAWLRRRRAWEDKVADVVEQNPLETLAALLIGSSVLFFVVESSVNPRVKTFWDALYYISTCASVGYADIFARTDVGKAISSLVMTFGPALCAQVFDRPTPQRAPIPSSELQAVIERLDAILAELRQLRRE